MKPAARTPRGDGYDPLAGRKHAAGPAIGPAEGRGVVPIDPAALLSGATPPADPRALLAEHLKRAWVAAGRPTMAEVGDQVGYSKASISKVLSGKMAPVWHLVRKLGHALSVPPEVVRDVWHPLWVDADELRRLQRQGETEPASGRHECPQCGSWVADPQVHQLWHGRMDSSPTDAHHWASLRDALPRRKD